MTLAFLFSTKGCDTLMVATHTKFSFVIVLERPLEISFYSTSFLENTSPHGTLRVNMVLPAVDWQWSGTFEGYWTLP